MAVVLSFPSSGGRRRLCRLALLFLLIAGCQQEEVQQYPVTKLPPPRGPFEYEMPEGWRVGPPAKLSILTLETGEGKDITRMTVTSLSGPAGGLLGNINRWRQQVGLEPIAETALEKDAPAREVGGRMGKFVEIIGKQQSILGAIVPGTRETLFFKFMGPAATVAANKAKFEQFLRSVKFDAVGGANDGK